MTLKKPSRAGLMALAFGILLGLFLSVAAYNTSYAQTPAPMAAPAAAPAAPAAPAALLHRRRRQPAPTIPIPRRPC